MLMRLKVIVGMSFIGYYGNCKEISISDFKLVDTKLMTVDFQPTCGSFSTGSWLPDVNIL